MQSFVINMPKQDKKLDRFMKYNVPLLVPLDIVPQTFPAVVGKDLDPAYLDTVLYPSVHYTIKYGRKQHREICTIGAVGCYLSHVSIWQKMVEQSIDSCLIFEDDAKPVSGITSDDLKMLFSRLPKDWDIVLLGSIGSSEDPHHMDEDVGDDFYKIKSITFQLHSYMINLKGAKKLLEKAFPITDQLDSLISYMCMRNVNGYRTKKDYFTQHNVEGTALQTDTCNSCFVNQFDTTINKYIEYKYIMPYSQKYGYCIVIVILVCWLIYMYRKRE